MEIVSNKIAVSAPSSPQGSQRSLERTGTFSQQPRRWNASTTTQQRTSHRRRESLTGTSLLSLKAYYRKLRTFKGTIKALISFRRLPTFSSRTASGAQAQVATLTEQDEEKELAMQEGEPCRVAKLTNDGAALQNVQNQVKDLVEKGHVVTELNGEAKDDVAYRKQGNLDHYTEDNLHRRLALQEHPHMVALTQRLWLSAAHEHEDHLSFGEYEAYMLRLHRLILPEFDLAQSSALIKDDWTRDTDGGDALDYRFFHFSMFELVDLWTDTVEAEDYISLLYCIMHSLTFEWNGRHQLKKLDDINPVDILDISKDVTMEEIERDLSREVNSDEAQLYRDRIAIEEDTTYENCEESAASALTDKDADATTASQHISKDPLNALKSTRASSASRTSNTRRESKDGKASQVGSSEFDPVAGTQRRVSSNLHIHGAGSRVGAYATGGLRAALAPTSGNQYASATSSDAPPISIMSLGAGGEYLNMVSKPTYVHRPSALASGGGSRQHGNHPSAGGEQAIFGQGLHNGHTSAKHLPTYEPSVQVHSSDFGPMGLNKPIVSGHGISTARSTSVVSPRSPQSPRANSKETETRQGSLLADGEQHRGSFQVGQGNTSPRTRSAKSIARPSPSSVQTSTQLYVANSIDRSGIMGASMALSSLDLQQRLGPNSLHDLSALVVGSGLQSPRMSIPARPHATYAGPANGLDGFLQTRSYQESSSSPTRPAARGTRVYHQRSSHTPVDDLAVMSLGLQQLSTGSPRVSSLSRPPPVNSSSPQQRMFAGSVVGSNSTLSVEARSPTPRSSMVKLSSARRIDSAGRNRAGTSVDLGLSGASARLSVHKETALSPRATTSKMKALIRS